MRDVDGNADERDRTVSVFNGPPPDVRSFGSPTEEIKAVSSWLNRTIIEGVLPAEIGVFVRSRAELMRARASIEAAGLRWVELSEHEQDINGAVSVRTMHSAKGLEFKAVAVIACDDGVLPLQSRLEAAADETELDEVYETERHLFYVACTRARDRLLISGVRPLSEFVQDLGSTDL